MKIKAKVSGIIYEFSPVGKSDEERYLCPQCSHLRKKNKDKCLAWNSKNEIAYCHNCNESFTVYRPGEKKEYFAPEWKNITALTDKAVKWFTGRMISQKTLNRMQIYSDNEYMPQHNSIQEVICFPFFFQDKLYNIKFRGPQKSFKQVAGAELIFYNLDAVLNYKEIIIVEGEIDALSYIECGIENVISVPAGANVGGKMEYLDDYISLFENTALFYIATDQDTKGIELKDELCRRLGPDRCMIVSFKDCKDANDYLLKYGGPALQDTVKEARPVPIKGIVKVDDIENDIYDLFNHGSDPGLPLNEPFDEYIKWEPGRLAIVTGVPSHGKSEFVDYLITKLNILYGWKVAYFTPENYPLKYHYEKIFEKLIGKKFNSKTCNEMEYYMALDHIKENFFYIMNEEDFTVKQIIDCAQGLVRTQGIKIVVIDPYNRLDHQYSDSETQYISRFLDKLTMFCRLNNVLLFLVAHPRKMNKEANGKVCTPSLYDINGSANFYNKADYGFTVYRKSDNSNVMINEVEIHWQKIKFKYLGHTGVSELKYNFVNGRFQKDTNWDNTNWLVRKAEQAVINYTEPQNIDCKWERDENTPPF